MKGFILGSQSRYVTEDLAGSLAAARDYEAIFRLVKRVVEERLGIRRAGLMLIIADAPTGVLAYHEVGSNAIVLNRRHLEPWLAGKSREDANSYIFVLLLHEYLHSLGILDEGEVRRLVKTLVNSYLGPEHMATKIARGGHLLSAMPETPLAGGPGRAIIVKDFDTENTTYIG
jgi:hypothetical protein